MNGDSGYEGMGIALLARVFLTLAVVAATTAAFRWLLSGQRKKTRAGSDADKAGLCLGRQSLDDADRREQESDTRAWEEAPAPPQVQAPQSDGSAQGFSSRGTRVLKVSGELEARQGSNGTPDNGGRCAGMGTRTDTAAQDTRHHQHGNWVITTSAASLFPKHRTAATGEPSALDCDMAPESDPGHLQEDGGEGWVTPSGGVGTDHIRVGFHSPGVPREADADSRLRSRHDADTVLLVSPLPVHAKQPRSHDIDYVATSSHGDSKLNSPDVEVSFENQSGLGIDPPGEPDTSLGAGAPCNGYVRLCGQRAVCQERGAHGESLPAAGGACQHLGTPVPPLQLPQEAGGDGDRGLQANTLNLVPGEREARELQCPWEAHPEGDSKQTMKPVSDFTAFTREINAGKSYGDTTDDELCTRSQSSTHCIPSLRPTHSETNVDCKKHEQHEFLASLKGTLDSGDSDNGTRESSLQTNVGLHSDGRTVHALPVRGETTSGHSTAEIDRLQAEGTRSEVGLQGTRQNAKKYPRGVTDASACEEGAQADLQKCDDTQDFTNAQRRVLTLEELNENLVPSQEGGGERETCEAKDDDTINNDLRGEDNSVVETEPGSHGTNTDREQLKMEISPFQGDVFSSIAEAASKTQSGSDWMHVDALPESVLSAEHNEQEFSASHVRSNDHDVIKPLSTEDISMIDPPQRAEHDFFSLSTAKADPRGIEKYSDRDRSPAGKDSSDFDSEETTCGFGQRNSEIMKPDFNLYSSNQTNARLQWEVPTVNSFSGRDETSSDVQTQENEQIQTEVGLQNTLLNIKVCSVAASEVCDYDPSCQPDLSKWDRDDTQVWTSRSVLVRAEETLGPLLSQPESKERKMHQAGCDNSKDTSSRRDDFHSNNSGFNTENEAQNRKPHTEQLKIEAFPSHDRLVSFTKEAGSETNSVVWVDFDAGSCLGLFLQKEYRPEELALPESVIPQELQEEELQEFRVSENGHNVDEQLSVEYLSTLQLFQHAQHDFLPLSSSGAASPGMEKCNDAGIFPVRKHTSCSLTNMETTPDSGQSDNEMADLDINRNSSIPTTEKFHWEGHTVNPFTITEEKASRRPREETEQLHEEGRESEAGFHGTPQNVGNDRLEAGEAEYGEDGQVDMSMCDINEGQMYSREKDKGSTPGKPNNTLVPSLPQGESEDQEHSKAKEEDFADNEPKSEASHGNTSGFETEPWAQGVNRETAPFIIDRMDIAATHDGHLPFETETALTTRSGAELLQCDAGSGPSPLQEKEDCPGDLGSVIENELLPSPVNESHEVAEQLSTHDMFTMDLSQHDHYVFQLSSSSNVGLPSMAEIKDVDRLPMEEGASSNANDVCPPGGIEETKDMTPKIPSKKKDASTIKNQKTDSCQSIHEDSVGSSCPSERQEASSTKNQTTDSCQSIHSVDYFCPFDKQEATTNSIKEIDSCQGIHEDSVGLFCSSEKQEAPITENQKTDLCQSVHKDSVEMFCSSDKQEAYAVKNQKTDVDQRIHEESVGPFSSSEKQDRFTEKSQNTDSLRSSAEDSVRPFCSSENQEASASKNRNVNSCRSIHEDSVGPFRAVHSSEVGLLHPVNNNHGMSDKRRNKLSHVMEYTLLNKETEYCTDLCQLQQEETPQPEGGLSCTDDGDNSYQYVCETEMKRGADLFLNNRPSTAEDGTNVDSETSESGYITENICTPVYDERSWSSLGADGEELESIHQEPEAILKEIEQNTETRRVTCQGQHNTVLATGNQRSVNQADNPTGEDNPDKKDNLTTAVSQCPSVESGVEDSDNVPHTLNNHPSTAEDATHLDSETSESGYITENISTPVYEERNWSSLGTEGEEVESMYREPEATLQEIEQNTETISVSCQGYHGIVFATVNQKNINQADNPTGEDNPDEKDNFTTAGSQYPSVESGGEDSDNVPHAPTIIWVCEGVDKHTDLASLPFQESPNVKLKDFCREDKQICKLSSIENIRICAKTDASCALEGITSNMLLDHMEVLGATIEQCHNRHETRPQLDTAENTEHATVGGMMAFMHGHRALEDGHEEAISHTKISPSKRSPGAPIPVDHCASYFGTISRSQEILKETNLTPQFEDIDNNASVDKALPDNRINLFLQCTPTNTGDTYESTSVRYLEETPPVEEATLNFKKLCSKPEGLGTSTTELQGLQHSGNKSHDLPTDSGQTTSSDVLENQTDTEQVPSVPKSSKDKKPGVLESTMSHGVIDPSPSGFSLPEDPFPMALNIVSGENEDKSREYVHQTRICVIPRTLSLPKSALRRIHSPPELLMPVLPIDSSTGFEMTWEGEHQLKSNSDHSSWSITPHVKGGNQTSPERSGLRRRGSISEIAENPALRVCGNPTQSPKIKIPQLAKSCENILSDTPSKKIDGRSKTQSMLCLLTEHYSLPVSKSQKSPVEFVAKGSFLNIPEALQSTEKAMKLQLNLGNCLELLKFAKKNRAGDLQEAAYMVMSDNYLQVLRDPGLYGQLNGGERDQILQLRMRGKKVLGVAELETIYGLKKNRQSSSCPAVNELQPHNPCTDLKQRAWLYTFDMVKNSWHPLTQIPEEANLKGCSICSLNNYLFLAGGIKGHGQDTVCSNKVFCYNPLTEIWRQVAPMKQARSQLKLVSVDGYLYAIGGECLYTVERYDPRLDKWAFRASLPKGTFAVAHEAATCNGEIYVSGGHLFYRLLKYIPLKDLWEECPYNTSRKRSSDMVAVRNFIYRFDIHRETGVSVFKYNTTTKIWNECATMCLSNPLPFRCVVLDEAVYCLNKKMTVRFSVDDRSQRFEPETLGAFPGGDGGALCPFVLTLPQPASLQTSV